MKNFEELSWEERKEIIERSKEEFIKTIDLEPLYEEIRNLVGDKEIYFNYEIRKDYIDIKSNELIDKIGMMGIALKSVRLETFNSSITYDQKEQKAYWWGSIDFRYQIADGGTNGMEVLRFELRDGKYLFRKVK